MMISNVCKKDDIKMLLNICYLGELKTVVVHEQCMYKKLIMKLADYKYIIIPINISILEYFKYTKEKIIVIYEINNFFNNNNTLIITLSFEFLYLLKNILLKIFKSLFKFKICSDNTYFCYICENYIDDMYNIYEKYLCDNNYNNKINNKKYLLIKAHIINNIFYCKYCFSNL